MLQEEHYEIRVLNESEIQLAVDWAAAEGWNPGLNDAAIFYNTDPQGFVAGFLEGKPIATISAIRYGENFGFVGFYVVKPEFRGRGFGLRLWKAAMDRLEGRNIGLDGVVAQQENYKKSGFSLAYRNVRFIGKGYAGKRLSSSVVPLSQVPFGQVAHYDGKLFFTLRPEFLQPWIGQPTARALGYVKEGRLQGYGVIRQCGAGCKIGPLFADNESIANALFLSLAGWADGQEVFLDIPAPNDAAQALVRKHGMSPVFETARMYTGLTPPIELAKVFGVTSFELG